MGHLIKPYFNFRTKSLSQHKVILYSQLDNIPNPVKIAKVRKDNSLSMWSFSVVLWFLDYDLVSCFVRQCFYEEITCEKFEPVLTTKGSASIVQFDEHNRTNLYKFGVICQKFRQVKLTDINFTLLMKNEDSKHSRTYMYISNVYIRISDKRRAAVWE